MPLICNIYGIIYDIYSNIYNIYGLLYNIYGLILDIYNLIYNIYGPIYNVCMSPSHVIFLRSLFDREMTKTCLIILPERVQKI